MYIVQTPTHSFTACKPTHVYTYTQHFQCTQTRMGFLLAFSLMMRVCVCDPGNVSSPAFSLPYKEQCIQRVHTTQTEYRSHSVSFSSTSIPRIWVKTGSGDFLHALCFVSRLCLSSRFPDTLRSFNHSLALTRAALVLFLEHTHSLCSDESV